MNHATHARQFLRAPAYFRLSAAAAILASASISAAAAPAVEVKDALATGALGLHQADEFRLANGRCSDCPAAAQALWYFRDDLVAVPRERASGFVRGARAQEDVRRWASGNGGKPAGERPPMLWIGSPQIVSGVQLSDDGQAIKTGNGSLPFAVTGKIPANLSYYDASSVRHFAARPLRMRGTLENGRFVARTLWPEDFALTPSRLPLRPLAAGESLSSLVRAEGGGATLPMDSRVLWQRDPGTPLQVAGKPVLTVMLNGAQGDDDEAHGGHFAIATGRFGERGEWGDWLVNNFYNLDSYSEKGIVAATLPMDAYMADLNSGQSWYRPSYMLVAVLKSERGAALYQEAINRVFSHFYRHDFRYRHASANCAGISMETMRSLGWAIPEQGSTSRLKAAVALPYMTIKEMSLDSGRSAFDYLVAETTNLYPFVAFEAAGNDLLNRIAPARHLSGNLDRMLADDLEALVYVRIPQFPSSRAFGQAPVASIDEYMARAPQDRADWKIVPVPPRPFPDALKDSDTLTEDMSASQIATYAYGGFFGVTALGMWRRRRGNMQRKVQ